MAPDDIGIAHREEELVPVDTLDDDCATVDENLSVLDLGDSSV